VIYDSDDQLTVIKEVMKSLQLDTKKFNPKALLNQISQAKTEMLGPKAYALNAEGFFLQTVAEVYPGYQKLLRANNAYDFDDLLCETVKLFQKNSDVLSRYQDLFKFIVIDEYQDTNHVQYLFAKLLAEKHHNICVVGDDAQSIYSFRGATIANILNFEKDYPDCKLIKLEQNYRSTKKILAASNEIISANTSQRHKELWTENEEGESITLFSAHDEQEEANWIAEKIYALVNAGESPLEIAVLYRTNAQSRSLEEAMLRYGISYKVVGNTRFYARREVKDVVAYLRLISNPNDNFSLKRVINTPRRGIGPKSVESVVEMAAREDLCAMPFLQKYGSGHKGLSTFIRVMGELQHSAENSSVAELIDDIVDKSGYYDMLNDGTIENKTRLENIQELKSLASTFAEFTGMAGLELFLTEVALIESQSARAENEPEYVTLMTIHAAKGLEFNHVFIAGLEENLFPHSNAMMDTDEMEEERRLAYVALTRAKAKLYLTHALDRTYFGARSRNPISRFVDSIPTELLEREGAESDMGFAAAGSKFQYDSSRFGGSASSLQKHRPNNYTAANAELKTGDKVQHQYFGIGVITEIADGVAMIKFSDELREIALEYAMLKRM
jgi:DNA helicase-2/ATP-dependent DNA helicase PcrA